jgi:hypothetical protein
MARRADSDPVAPIPDERVHPPALPPPERWERGEDGAWKRTDPHRPDATQTQSRPPEGEGQTPEHEVSTTEAHGGGATAECSCGWSYHARGTDELVAHDPYVECEYAVEEHLSR